MLELRNAVAPQSGYKLDVSARWLGVGSSGLVASYYVADRFLQTGFSLRAVSPVEPNCNDCKRIVLRVAYWLVSISVEIEFLHSSHTKELYCTRAKVMSDRMILTHTRLQFRWGLFAEGKDGVQLDRDGRKSRAM